MGNFRKHSPRVFWSEAEVNILMEHYPSLSAAELLEKLPGRTIRVIQCKANGLGLSRTKPQKRTAEQTMRAGADAMIRCKGIWQRHGRFGFTGPDLIAVQDALELYEGILRLSKPLEMERAVIEVERRIVEQAK